MVTLEKTSVKDVLTKVSDLEKSSKANVTIFQGQCDVKTAL